MDTSINEEATAVEQPASEEVPPVQVEKVAPAGGNALFWLFWMYGTAPVGHREPLQLFVGYTEVSFTV